MSLIDEVYQLLGSQELKRMNASPTFTSMAETATAEEVIEALVRSMDGIIQTYWRKEVPGTPFLVSAVELNHSKDGGNTYYELRFFKDENEQVFLTPNPETGEVTLSLWKLGLQLQARIAQSGVGTRIVGDTADQVLKELNEHIDVDGLVSPHEYSPKNKDIRLAFDRAGYEVCEIASFRRSTFVSFSRMGKPYMLFEAVAGGRSIGELGECEWIVSSENILQPATDSEDRMIMKMKV